MPSRLKETARIQLIVRVVSFEIGTTVKRNMTTKTRFQDQNPVKSAL